MEDWSYLPPDFGGTPVVATYEFAKRGDGQHDYGCQQQGDDKTQSVRAIRFRERCSTRDISKSNVSSRCDLLLNVDKQR
jgi:hypothetical protein